MRMIPKLLLSVSALAAVAVLSSSCLIVTGDEGQAMVRFTWEASQRGYIREIIAGYEDVRYWKDYVYAAPGYVVDDATDIPRYGGSYDIANKIYSDLSPQGATKYKGVYLSVSSGDYTAICTVEDVNLRNTFDIVANYKIRAGEPGATRYYEVVFDVGAFLAGKNETGYSFYEYDNPDEAQKLRKASGEN